MGNFNNLNSMNEFIKLTFGIAIIASIFSYRGTDTYEPSSNTTDSLINLISMRDQKTDSLFFDLGAYESRFRGLVFSSSGNFEYLDSESEEDPYGHNYRVEIYLSEIYKSLLISHIVYFGEGNQKIGSQIKVDPEKELGIGHEETNSFEFVQWISPKDFEIQFKDNMYRIVIMDGSTVTINQIYNYPQQTV